MEGEILRVVEEFSDAPKGDLLYDGPAMMEWVTVREIDKAELDGMMRNLIFLQGMLLGHGGMKNLAGAAFRLGFEVAAKRYASGIPSPPPQTQGD